MYTSCQICIYVQLLFEMFKYLFAAKAFLFSNILTIEQWGETEYSQNCAEKCCHLTGQHDRCVIHLYYQISSYFCDNMHLYYQSNVTLFSRDLQVVLATSLEKNQNIHNNFCRLNKIISREM